MWQTILENELYLCENFLPDELLTGRPHPPRSARPAPGSPATRTCVQQSVNRSIIKTPRP